MCVFQCDAATVESHPAPLAEDVVLVSARKLPPLDLLPLRIRNKKHCVEQDGRTFVNYRHGTHHSTTTWIILRTRLWNIELFVHLLLVSSAVVLVVVVVSLCVRRTVCALHARTSLDTASSHRSLYLAVLCLALAILTVATKCYATATTVHPLSQQPSSQTPSQTTLLLPSTSSQHTALRLVQSVPSSIAHSRIFLSRPDFFTTAKRKKRTSTDHGVLRYQGSNSDQHQVHNDTTTNLTNSVTSVGVVRLRLDTSGPVRQQSTVRPMPSAHDEPTHTVSDDIAGGIETGGGTASGGSGGGSSDTGGGGGNRFLALVISAALLTVTLGLITCVVNCYRDSTTTGTLAAGSTVQQHSLVVPVLGAEEHHVPVITQPITAPMLSVVSASAAGMDAGGGGAAGRLHRHVTRELAAQRDRQVRLHSVHTDLELDLPPSIALPDGEELPYGSSARLHIRDPEQESEIYQKCIRPPPNRTVFESESPPPYRSSSAGLLGSLGGSTSSNSTTGVSGSSDWSTGSTPFVVRCHSMSSTSTTTTKRTLEPQLTNTSAAAGPASATAAAAAAATAGGGQKTDFLQRTVKIFTGKKNNTPLPQPAPTLPVVVVPTPGVRTTRRLAEQTAPTRAKHQGNV